MDSDERGATATAPADARPQPAAGGKGSRGGGRRRPLASTALLYREVVAELRKVIWPTRRELISYTVVVLTFVTIMVAIVAGLDFGFVKAVAWVFG